MKKVTLFMTLLFFGIVIISFSGCKKYEEGPRISLRSKKARVAGDWKVTSFTINGVDAFKDFSNDNMQCLGGDIVYYTESFTVTNYEWSFDKDGKWDSQLTSSTQTINDNQSYDDCVAVYDVSTETSSNAGEWDFLSGKDKMQLTYKSSSSSETWEIKELKEKEMKLEMIDGTDRYNVTFTKKK